MNNIKTLRKMLGLSQTEFGEKLGVSRDVIGNIEYGRVIPKEVFINHICAVFDTNRDWLLENKGEPFNSNMKLNKDLKEAENIFSKLHPQLQEYALQQLRSILELQNKNQSEE